MKNNKINFNDEQLLRYSRQIMLPHFGVEGQQRLQNAHVVMMGVGGLGSPAAMYLAAAGVGTLTLIDFDTVDHSNLQRQIIHKISSVGDSKVESAKNTLQKINPEVTIHSINKKLTLNELKNKITNADCVIDATDNFETRFIINRACVSQKIALVSAAAIQYEGQISVFDFSKKNSACYACLYAEGGEENTNCSDNGILAPVVGILGSMQALEAIKLICQLGETLQNRLLIFDALALQWRTMKLKKDPNCPVCNK
ncbi:Molybdopterin-synthase adenylyltransferase [hydrothermal vent metagenome]|uniref:Molybdopterin-synthase adenylyltransferase n=1 Tax=hydrothermal vent metagenome TaxID=652676 RepID=A0A3B0WKZ9_9ZZZZ